MNILTFYFSGTGNTKWVINQLDCLLKENGHTSAYTAIEDMDINDDISDMISSADYIGLAYPLYGANIPRIMRNFISRFIQDIKSNKSITKKLFLINTFAFVNGHGIFEATKLFAETPTQIMSYVNIKMPNSAPLKNGHKVVSKSNYDQKIVKNAQKKLSTLVVHLENSKKYINGIGPHLLVGKLIRRILRNELKDNYKHMHVDMQSCTKCMKCVKNCPTNCIQYENDKFIFTRACEACMRCYHCCPTFAIYNLGEK